MIRSVVTVVLTSVLLACGEKGTPAPPRTTDRVAELKTYDPTAPFIRPNPPPSNWMIGCYEIRFGGDIPYTSSLPMSVEFANEPARMFGFHQLYVVRAVEKRIALSSWQPYTASEVRANIGTGFHGWGLELRQTESGLAGTATPWSDASGVSEARVPVRLVKKACR
jgi:hypothetical protein